MLEKDLEICDLKQMKTKETGCWAFMITIDVKSLHFKRNCFPILIFQ